MKISQKSCVQLGAVLLAVTMSACAARAERVREPHKRQVGAQPATLLDTEHDRQAQASGFLGHPAGHVQAHSKYFQYAHVPHKDHHETGHRKGNEHHFTERHEKVHPHAGEFKTKVRWGDKHGGYGEHYWDYNHAGHGDSHDEGSEPEADYKTYDDEAVRRKREPKTREPSLVLDPATGHVVDERTGRKYVLQPLN